MKDKSEFKLFIVGAGVSGLIAAQVLENHGYSPSIIEATDRVGGRVKTDVVEGYQLDHGFQVMLEAYPKAKEYLDYSKLNLQKLLPGAVVFQNGNSQTLGDPIRALSLAIPTVLSSVGTIKDKIKVLKLNNELASKTLDQIFSTEEKTTFQYLKKYGFSDQIIASFFKPFFSGIFLETELQTSSRMFEFIYKMFGEGLAVIPEAGIGAVSEQLKNNLKRTTFEFDSSVKQVTNERVILNDGTVFLTDSTIIATEASHLIPNLNNQEVAWKAVDNLYFEVEKPVLDKPIIGLFKDQGGLINNIFYPTSVNLKTKGPKTLLSVSIVKDHHLSQSALINAVEKELKTEANITTLRFLKHYHISKALPVLNNVKYTLEPTETRLSTKIFLAGDQQLNGSLNAAIVSGEQAALGLIKALEGGIVS